jgi:uncharacterized protein
MTEAELPSAGRLIACDALVGAPRVPLPDYSPNVADLEAEMARLQISAAVVRHRVSLEVAGHYGNDVLRDEVAGKPHLLPVWFVTPDGREPHFDPALTLAEMLAAGVRFAWTDPVVEDFSLRPWCCGQLYAALQEHRVPLLLDCGKINLSELHEALTAYPRLRVVLLQVPRLGRNRNLEPLLALHPELYLCFAPAFSVHGYWPDLCRRYGPERWLWGSHYPDSEGGAAITGLTYSGLSHDEQQAVAHGNLERLLAEVIL